MTSTELPLLELFAELRRAGMQLGVDEYMLALRALRGGFGLDGRESLRRMCHTLWANTPDEQRLLDYHFDRIIAQDAPPPPMLGEAGAGPAAAPRVEDIQLAAPAAANAGAAAPAPAPAPTAQAARVLARMGAAGGPLAVFASAGEHFPLTRRQMKQAWRHLRRPTRIGPPVELDLDATIARIARDGMLVMPVLRPRRVNRAELLLLIDRNGSMVPFHGLSQQLIETATRGGRLGQAGVGYFHNCPADYLYHDAGQQRAEPIGEWLARLSGERVSVMIMSDAGAARGGFSPERALLTAAFLSQLKARFARVAWLNPMPRARWQGTTAEVIARLVPMFELGRIGLDGAIDALRGRASRGM